MGGDVCRYELPGWREELGLAAGIATTCDDVDYGLGSDRPIERTLASWWALREQAGVFDTVVVSRQVHGAAIAAYRGPVPDGVLIREGFDGHVTDVPGVLLAVTVADCVPVFLANTRTGMIGLLHAGWRGIAAGILEAGVREVTRGSGAAATNVVIHCGVAICGECYEVGPEVVSAVTGRPAASTARIDLRANLVERARALGLTRVTVSPHCTAHDPRFASHRTRGAAAGRMAAYLGRPPA